MSIGSGIALFVVGAVLAFAVNIETSIVDLHLIGYILMGAGLVVFILGLAFTMRRRQSTSTTRSAVDPASGEQVTRRTTDTDGPVI
ncbi:hypothetical protein HQQ80_01395 [Microbacteriaceae bacterium VKM Ac-2855]|nr:hypothetical protein [Microbacteriaceae bacterium VKM Ac-2855]